MNKNALYIDIERLCRIVALATVRVLVLPKMINMNVLKTWYSNTDFPILVIVCSVLAPVKVLAMATRKTSYGVLIITPDGIDLVIDVPLDIVHQNSGLAINIQNAYNHTRKVKCKITESKWKKNNNNTIFKTSLWCIKMDDWSPEIGPLGETHPASMPQWTSPAETRRNNNVIMTSKRRRNVVLTS